MIKLFQYQKTGEIFVEELPRPQLRPGGVLVQNKFSLISAGTEKSSVNTAQASIFGKAKRRPDLVKQVIDNFHREGLSATYKKVKNRLDNFKELGYTSAGVVIESSVDDFQVGDKVACSGVGYAGHAEVVFVPKNLTCKIPESVSYEEGAFGTIGAIAMQGVRQAILQLGERVAVMGLGLLGQLTVQIVNSMGCSVIGLDISPDSLALAKKRGASKVFLNTKNNVEQKVINCTDGIGVDAVIITAATFTNDPIEITGDILRDRGRAVIVGAVKADIPRMSFYNKEIDIRFSRSYGPGRYDYNYEEKGFDYPIGYVRFTEQRNVQSFLELIERGSVTVHDLISHRIPIENGIEAYDILTGKKVEKFTGIVIQYKDKKIETNTKYVNKSLSTNTGKNGISFIGAGNFAQSNLLPYLKKEFLSVVCTTNPLNAKSVSTKFKFKNFTTSAEDVFADNNSSTIFITTRHDSHAKYVLKALRSKKNIFVEKPLTVTREDFNEIKRTYFEMQSREETVNLLVGYNRRFSAPIIKLKDLFSATPEPMFINYRVNAGALPKNSWYKQPGQGFRIFSEGCHFIDVMQYITDAEPMTVFAKCIKSNNVSVINVDTISVTISFSNGAVGILNYISNGDNKLPKERIELSSNNCSAIMDNFKEVVYFGNKVEKFKFNGSKGHKQEVQEYIKSIKNNKQSPISFNSLIKTTETTFAIIKSIETGQVVSF